MTTSSLQESFPNTSMGPFESVAVNTTFNESTGEGYGNGTFNVQEFIEGRLGPPRMGYNTLLPVTVIYALIAVGGIVGNFLTCLVVARNHSMRTSTNYYLVNLAVADLIALCFALPVEVYSLWVQYPWPLGDAGCRLRAVVAEALTFVSILTILAVSGERYVAITDPVIARTTHTLTRTTRVLPAIWLVALLAASPWGYYQQVNHLRSAGGSVILESAWCAVSFSDTSNSYQWVVWLSSVGGFILPMLILIVLYYKIGVVLSIDPPSRTPTAGNGAMHTRKMGIRMLVAVVVVFFLCWAPFHAQRLMFVFVSIYGKWSTYLRTVNQKLYCFTGICYYLNSAVNPILYSVMSVRFRIAFRKSLCGGKEWARRQQYLSNTYGAQPHSYTSNILNRTREVSTTSTKYITRAGSKRMGMPDFCSRNGFNYVFEHMEIEA